MHMQLHDVSMIQDMDRDKRNLIVYDMVTGTKFLLRASKPSLRNVWLDRANLLIEEAKQLATTERSRSRSNSEPPEVLAQSLSMRKGWRKERERDGGSKRKIKRPSSSTGVRETSLSPSSPTRDRPSKTPKKMVSNLLVIPCNLKPLSLPLEHVSKFFAVNFL